MTRPYTIKELNHWIKRAEMTYASMGMSRKTLIKDYFTVRNEHPELNGLEAVRKVINDVWALWFKISCPEKMN